MFNSRFVCKAKFIKNKSVKCDEKPCMEKKSINSKTLITHRRKAYRCQNQSLRCGWIKFKTSSKKKRLKQNIHS